MNPVHFQPSRSPLAPTAVSSMLRALFRLPRAGLRAAPTSPGPSCPVAWAQLVGRLDWPETASARAARRLATMVKELEPTCIKGTVIKGFGRGSKELGIPTANLPEEVVDALPEDVTQGIYYGWAKVGNDPVEKSVMSVGWNPYYDNTKRSAVGVAMCAAVCSRCGPVLHMPGREDEPPQATAFRGLLCKMPP